MLTFLILALATWRLSSLLTDEAGPLDVFVHLRRLVGVRYNDAGEAYGSNGLARGVTCVWCVSVWVGAAWAVVYYVAPGLAFYLALPFALSAGAILINEVLHGKSQYLHPITH